MSPAQVTEWRGRLESYLQERGYIKPVSADAAAVRWVLVKSMGAMSSVSGDAKPFCRILGCWDGSAERWIGWTEKNRSLADVVWRRVIDHVSREQWLHARLLLEFVDGQSDLKPDDIHEFERQTSGAGALGASTE